MVALAVLACLGCGGGDDPISHGAKPCTLPMGGTFEVIEHAVDNTGCGDGTPDQSLAQFAMVACAEAGAFLVSTQGEASCLQGGRSVTRLEAADRCSGESGMSMTIERQGNVTCSENLERVDATLAGDTLVLELRRFEHTVPADADGGCPEAPCTGRTRIVGRRLP